MIKEMTPMSMSESLEYIQGEDDKSTEIKGFIKKFVKISPKDAKEMREKLEALDLLKLKPEYIVKIVDVLPDNSENLNKIFSDVSLDEDETKKILDIVKEFK